MMEMAKSNTAVATSNLKIAENLGKIAGHMDTIIGKIFQEMLTKADLVKHEEKQDDSMRKLFTDIKAINEDRIRAEERWRVVKAILGYGGAAFVLFAAFVWAANNFTATW